MTTLHDPTPDTVLASRLAAGLTQAQAAALVHLGNVMRWSEYERGVRRIDTARWELWLLLVGQHPTLRLIEAPAGRQALPRGRRAVAAPR